MQIEEHKIQEYLERPLDQLKIRMPQKISVYK